MKLTKEEKEILEVMEDHRSVNKTLEDAFYDGSLSEFRKFIIDYNKGAEKQDKIAVLLRGNSNSIIAYYHNHKLWELSIVGKNAGMNDEKNGRVSFDFDHARYTSEWKKIFNDLIEEGFAYSQDGKNSKNIRLTKVHAMKVKKNKHGVIIGGTIGDIYCVKEKFSREFVEKNFAVVKGLIHDFFDTSKEHVLDHFKEEVKEEYECGGRENSGSTVLVEKIWQQRLFFEFKNWKDGLYVYDLEFSQPFPDKNKLIIPYAKEHGERFLEITADAIKEKLKTNSPDMFAIRFKDDKLSLVMIEVKSTKTACEGESGIEKHLEGMQAYTKQPIFMKNRMEDAYTMLRQFKRFGFLPEECKITESII